MKIWISLVSFLFLACTAQAAETILYDFDGDFDDATFAVENAIVDKGLNVEYVSHVGEMLERTKADVGGGKQIFKAADIFLFCSAVVSRKVMEADPMNIAHCPYGLFVIETDAGVQVGHQKFPAGAMQQVQSLLASIAKVAVE